MEAHYTHPSHSESFFRGLVICGYGTQMYLDVARGSIGWYSDVIWKVLFFRLIIASSFISHFTCKHGHFLLWHECDVCDFGSILLTHSNTEIIIGQLNITNRSTYILHDWMKLYGVLKYSDHTAVLFWGSGKHNCPDFRKWINYLFPFYWSPSHSGNGNTVTLSDEICVTYTV